MWSTLNPTFSSLAGKRVWIIGASSGIGAALATQALHEGAQVILSARRIDALMQVAKQHQAAQLLPFDVCEVALWQSAFETIVESGQGVDLVVFCAGDYLPERAWDVTPESAKKTINVNLMSVYSGLSTILPAMMERGSGGIVLVASVAGYVGLPNASVYGPSKAALINLAEVLYTDLHPKGIGVYLVNPGFVKTPLTAKNEFEMPALQTPEQAAGAIWQGVKRGRFEIHFPWRFTTVLKLIRWLPYRWQFALMSKLVSE
ncbi:SDR family NAD(P)-dependent oxidoreductase [Leeia sp. TBRC 13508]|uniref:SDR family NAD(P)-dependent oxidoreductase n=1 Tax=Leeia speluncae TaxID=2884804 RepID=A0ABS8D6Z6_9NEIS|nr:SDR family NAD(P)-dependent oxidoreductase [Leeia speluncae]MCB6183968.1 SDR family NAD(P)-dependent oxidoreductase [Leeia speluncae]